MLGFGLDNLFTKSDSEFEAVQEFLGNITWINAGGCGVAALAMYRWLKKNNKLSKDTAFVYLDNDKWMHENNKKALETNDVEPTSCSHVALQHAKRYVDAEGEVNIRFRFQYKLRIESEAFVLASVNNINVWNPRFNRIQLVPFIAEQLGIDLSDIQLYRSDEHSFSYEY